MIDTYSIKKTKVFMILTALLMLVAIMLPIRAAAMQPAYTKAAKPGSQTIASLAVNNGNFNTLVAALTCTGLVPAVSGNRQLTVFAPTDAAFAKLGLNVSNVCDVPDLSNILLYHVIPGRQTSNSVLARSSYQTLSGNKLTRTEVANAGLVTTDLSAKNGIVHVIGSVLIP